MASKEIAVQLEKTHQRLRKERAQWVYFDRNLRLYEGTRAFILKPMQRFYWTESQLNQISAQLRHTYVSEHRCTMNGEKLQIYHSFLIFY
jgi:hypothetical protein